MPDSFHAPPDTVLGQIQRGRGLGYQRLLQQPRPVAHRLLTQCILRDPRMDYQCENRGDYYAELARRVDLPLEPLAARLREEDDQCDEYGLTWQTLRSLCKQGSTAATEILLEDCRTYEDWPNHVETLVAFPDPEVTARLAAIIESRYATASSLHEALGWAFLDKPTWQVLGRHSERIREAVNHPNARSNGREEENAFREHLATLDLRGLLEFARANKRIFGLRRFIEAAVGPDDVGFLREQVVQKQREEAVGALWGLAKIANPELFGWLRDRYLADAEMWRPLRGAFISAMAALPAQVTLPLARDWLDHTNVHFSGMAEDLMKKHATPQDLPLLQAALRNSLGREPETSYRICGLAMAIERLESIGPVPELELAFESALHSCARWYLVPALRSTDPGGFRERFAAECLWDCEADVQLAGVEEAPLDAAGVPLRLDQLASGSWVDPEVREVATRRLEEAGVSRDEVSESP